MFVSLSIAADAIQQPDRVVSSVPDTDGTAARTIPDSGSVYVWYDTHTVMFFFSFCSHGRIDFSCCLNECRPCYRHSFSTALLLAYGQ